LINRDGIEELNKLNGTERVDAPPQLNPFAMAAREAAEHKQTEML
jgi:hypothetical protein